ncbi:MAG TPA: GAF domain-containing protein [Candidatus Dormibacteraeota bacterium]|jgi:signal transduction histidine kinase
MPSRDDGSACVAVADLLKLSAASRRVTGLLNASTIAGRATRELGALVGTDVTALGLREGQNLVVTRAGWHIRNDRVRNGLEIPMGDGVGGRVLGSARPVAVADYNCESSISPRLVESMRTEGVRAMLGVPICFRGRVIGVLYAANRSPGEIGDRAQTLAVEFAGTLGPALGAAMHARRASRLSALEERQRISRDLHDNLSPLLFGIGTAVRRTSDALPAAAEDLLTELRCIEARASQAASSLRDILRALAPANSEEGLPAVVRMDVSSFANFTGIAADLAVIGEPYELSGEQESVLVAVVREGLHNVGKHAHASSVVITLHYGVDSADVLIQDDGTGLPEDFTVTDVPRDGCHYGLASLSQRLARVGGELVLGANEDGGMTLHASLPTGTS